jgi:GDP-L-fucose synthase
MNLSKNTKIFVCGHRGMLGTAIMEYLDRNGFTNIVTRSHSALDLVRQSEVEAFFEAERPELVILAAAKVGGIQANIDNPATFLYDNLMMESNVIHASYRFGVKQFVFLGSSCIYPRECPQPMKEEYLLTGKLEPTNEGYAISKIAGIKLLQGYYKQYGFRSISLMPCNLYGPNDSFDLKHSHVLSALVKRFSDARDNGDPSITLWGTGIARREFMHVHDVTDALFYMIEHYDSPDFINIGTGTDVSIKELAEMIAAQTGYEGEILWDHSKPDGMLRKCMDVSRMKALGYMPSISLEAGIAEMIKNYQQIKLMA